MVSNCFRKASNLLVSCYLLLVAMASTLRASGDRHERTPPTIDLCQIYFS